MSSDRIEIWRRVDNAEAVRREGDWLEADLKGGDVLRIYQPTGEDGGGRRNEGPVVFENFRYEDNLPDPVGGAAVTEQCRIKEKNGAGWQSPFPGAKNVVAAQVQVNGNWKPHPVTNPPAGKFIKWVTYTPGQTPVHHLANSS